MLHDSREDGDLSVRAGRRTVRLFPSELSHPPTPPSPDTELIIKLCVGRCDEDRNVQQI
jgi:hypothetical protein